MQNLQKSLFYVCVRLVRISNNTSMSHIKNAITPPDKLTSTYFFGTYMINHGSDKNSILRVLFPSHKQQPTNVEMPTTKITVISVALARLYFSVLLDHLKKELNKPESLRDITIRYGKIVEQARASNPNAPYIEAAIPTNIGTRLLVVELICERLALPNLACLGVNATGEPGIAYHEARDWEIDKAAVLAYDWDNVSNHIANAFDIEAKEATQRAETKRPKKLSEIEARDLLYKADKTNPGKYKVDHYQKEAMIKLIMKGLTMDDAYAEVID